MAIQMTWWGRFWRQGLPGHQDSGFPGDPPFRRLLMPARLSLGALAASDDGCLELLCREAHGMVAFSRCYPVCTY